MCLLRGQTSDETSLRRSGSSGAEVQVHKFSDCCHKWCPTEELAQQFIDEYDLALNISNQGQGPDSDKEMFSLLGGMEQLQLDH